jgi:hypothetical protein
MASCPALFFLKHIHFEITAKAVISKLTPPQGADFFRRPFSATGGDNEKIPG